MTELAPTRTGRPRRDAINESVLAAARELLVEVGYQALTVAAIAERSTTSKPAIYRRWPSKAHIVHEAVFPETLHMPAATGNFVADLRAVVRGVVEVFATPAARAATPGLLGEMTARPELQGELTGRFSEPVWRWLDERIDEAVRTGEARPGVDSLVLVETIVGSVLAAAAFRGSGEIDATWIDLIVEQLLHGVGPTQPPA